MGATLVSVCRWTRGSRWPRWRFKPVGHEALTTVLRRCLAGLRLIGSLFMGLASSSSSLSAVCGDASLELGHCNSPIVERLTSGQRVTPRAHRSARTCKFDVGKFADALHRG
jgi:hypothetical protein